MASKQSLKLFDIKNKLIGMSLRTADFLRHSLLRTNREMLIVGDLTNPVVDKIREKVSQGNWNATYVGQVTAQQINELNSHNIECISLEENYKEVEEKLLGKKFNAIMVPPISPSLHQ